MAAGGTAAAIIGKTSEQLNDAPGRPIHSLNVLAHDLKPALADGLVGDGKATGPEALRTYVEEPPALYRSPRVVTGAAPCCRWPLARAIIAAGPGDHRRWPGRSSPRGGTTCR